MILIDFVIIITAQRIMLRSEIDKGYLFIAGIESSIANYPEPTKRIHDRNFKGNFEKLLKEAGYACGLVLGTDDNKILFDGQGCSLQRELEILTRQSILAGDKITRYQGTTWGVFWQQSRHLILAAPIFRKGRVVVGASVVLPLEKTYSSLRQTQYIIFIYIFINTVVLTLVGLYRLSRLTVKPLQRLVKRADEYREDDEIIFLSDKGDNEFNKLSRALNSMLTNIAADKETLRMTVKSLEEANLDLKQAQQDVIRAEKLASVGRLSSGIAHEIGNPIGIVVGYLELLKQDDITDEDRREFILRTESEINRINSIIRQLLDFSRPDSEQTQTFSVHDILTETMSVVQLQPSMVDIDLQLDLLAEEDTVVADGDHLRQVFLNLLINAADAISSLEKPVEGRISVTSSAAVDSLSDINHPVNMIKIDVTDNGPGIPKENLGNIFDPFFTTKDPGKGTGLGLSVCFMIVDGMGGKIGATSADGSGTTMEIYLPLSAENQKRGIASPTDNKM